MIYYLNYQEIQELHDNIIALYWWLSGIQNTWQAQSLLEHIQNNEYYPTLLSKTTHLLFWLIQFHCFNDWNKRTAIAATDIFLQVNNIFIVDLPVKLEDIAIWVAKWILNKDELSHILHSICISFWYTIT